MNRALYRVYRSKSFDEVVGQQHVTALLSSAIDSGRISHAYLLTGPRGTGKTSIARIIAHKVNQLEYSTDQHLDIIEIDAASNRRIDDIRDLRDKAYISPVSARYKVYIIDEVHMLTGESFNALLKTLEEPPEHVIFILATTEVHKLPATIVSRTQRFHLKPAKTEDIVTHLAKIAKQESIDVTSDALTVLAGHAGGSFRDSLSLLDQVSGLGVPVDTKVVQTLFGMADEKLIKDIVEAVSAHNTDTIIRGLDSLFEEGVSAINIVEQLTTVMVPLAHQKHELYGLIDELCDVARAHDPALKLTALLVKASLEGKDLVKKSPMPLVATKAVAVAKKPSELRAAKSEVKAVTTVIEEPIVAVTVEASTSGSFSWDQTLETIHKHYAPLHSVLKRADVTYDETSQTITLAFQYTLHRKKLENAQYRKQLASVISDLFGFQPELVLTDPKSDPVRSKEAGDIAAIMGGGELISGAV